jgi:hypothetical protein
VLAELASNEHLKKQRERNAVKADEMHALARQEQVSCCAVNSHLARQLAHMYDWASDSEEFQLAQVCFFTSISMHTHTHTHTQITTYY